MPAHGPVAFSPICRFQDQAEARSVAASTRATTPPPCPSLSWLPLMYHLFPDKYIDWRLSLCLSHRPFGGSIWRTFWLGLLKCPHCGAETWQFIRPVTEGAFILLLNKAWNLTLSLEAGWELTLHFGAMWHCLKELCEASLALGTVETPNTSVHPMQCSALKGRQYRAGQ